MNEFDEAELLRAISTDFYLEGRSKVDIAKEYGLSRFQVARMLDTARERGIVTITVRDPAAPVRIRCSLRPSTTMGPRWQTPSRWRRTTSRRCPARIV